MGLNFNGKNLTKRWERKNDDFIFNKAFDKRKKLWNI